MYLRQTVAEWSVVTFEPNYAFYSKKQLRSSDVNPISFYAQTIILQSPDFSAMK